MSRPSARDDYLQSDYQGLFAFLQPTFPIVRKEGDKQTTLQAEKAGAQVSFQSVFLHVPRRTVARVPDGVMIDEPFFLPGEEYEVAPGDNVKSVPKFSYRAKLAELATNGSNEAFNRNIANRLWALMFGRGLVHPLDLQNPDNPPSNPELLQLLAQQIAAMNFDMRGVLARDRADATRTSARSIRRPTVLSLADKAAKEAARLQEGAGRWTRLPRHRARLTRRPRTPGKRSKPQRFRLPANWIRRKPIRRCQEESRRSGQGRGRCGVATAGEEDGRHARSTGGHRGPRSRQSACRRTRSWSTRRRNSWPALSSWRPKPPP